MTQAVAILKFTCLPPPPPESPRGAAKKTLHILSTAIRAWVTGGTSAFGPCTSLIADYGGPCFYLVEESPEEIANLMEMAGEVTGQAIKFISLEGEPEEAGPQIVKP